MMNAWKVEKAIKDATNELPDAVRVAIAKVKIFVVESATDLKTLRGAIEAAQLGEDDPPVHIPPDFRGMFLGSTIDPAADDEDPDPVLAHGVFLFNAAYLLSDEDVHLTFFHEVGHALGLDEQEVEALGLQ